MICAFHKNWALKAILCLLFVSGLSACGPSESPDDETVVENGPIPPTHNKTEKFREPNPTPAELARILSRYALIDPKHEVPQTLLREALVYYDTNQGFLGNTSVLSVVDFSQYSGLKRFYIIDMNSGAVTSTYVAHGKMSDPNWTGYSTSFSNKDGSNKSSLGFYLTEETYTGAHGFSMRLDGLSTTNSNVRSRAIVVHSAAYVHEENVKQGRSLGCLALAPDQRDHVIGRLKGGSLIFAGLSGSSTDLASVGPIVSPGYRALFPAAWESLSHPERQLWTSYAYDLVEKYGSNLLLGTTDMDNFCPKYSSLSENQKTTFWTYLVSAIAKFESNFDPTSRYIETALGIDPITKSQVASEGLLQLSYQDVVPYPFCNQFDWSADKHLSVTDPKKTIFDPLKNLTCGIQILNKQVGSKKQIAVKGYWSVLNPNGKYGKVVQIKALVKKIPFCF